MNSNLFSVNLKDVLNGLFTAVLGAITTYLIGVFAALYQLVINGQPFEIQVNFQAMIVMGVFAGLVYLQKRFFSNSENNVLTK